MQGGERFGHQHIDNRFFDGARNIGAITRGAAGLGLHQFQHRRLEAAETEIQVTAVEHRARQAEPGRVAVLGQPGQRRATGVTQTQQLGAFVKGLAGRIINRLPQQGVLAHPFDAHQLGVPARDQEGDKGEGGRLGSEQGRQQMAFEVVHADGGNAQRQCQRVAGCRAHQQGAGQARAAREGDGVEIARANLRFVQHAPGQRQHAPDVIARRQLRDHAAVVFMHRHLRMQGLRQQAVCRVRAATQAVVERDAGFVAGGFDAEDKHGQVRPPGWNKQDCGRSVQVVTLRARTRAADMPVKPRLSDSPDNPQQFCGGQTCASCWWKTIR